MGKGEVCTNPCWYNYSLEEANMNNCWASEKEVEEIKLQQRLEQKDW